MITLTLLHPLKSIPVQKWSFKPNSVIKIGRANDNDVVLYSAVVSRYHLEIKQSGSDWVLVNLGANGTFINGKKVQKVLVEDGLVFRLASSGPQIKIRLDDTNSELIKEVVENPESSPISNQETSRDKDTTREIIAH